MLLNDVQPDKRLAYLLGVQVERYEFGKYSGLAARVIVLSSVVVLLVLGAYVLWVR
jgi:hypothetical protein